MQKLDTSSGVLFVISLAILIDHRNLGGGDAIPGAAGRWQQPAAQRSKKLPLRGHSGRVGKLYEERQHLDEQHICIYVQYK